MGDRSESNRLKRVPQTRPAPFGFGHIWSWSSESNTRRRGTSSLHCHCARPASLELKFGYDPKSVAYRATALPLSYFSLELARRFERRSRTYEARTLPTELHQQKFSKPGGGGENCTPAN